MSLVAVHLVREDVSLVLASSPSAVPTIVHWGARLSGLGEDELAGLVSLQAPVELHSSHDTPRLRGIVGENVTGFTGQPGLEGVRQVGSLRAWAPRLVDWSWSYDDQDEDARVTLESADAEAGWLVRIEVELTREGVVRMRTRVTNIADEPLELCSVRSALPVGAHAVELLDLTGRWCREREPQRRPWMIGTNLRESRHGRTGHDASLVTAAGTRGFDHRTGEVWATHLAWSGDHALHAERTPEGECLLGGEELLGPGEVTLAAEGVYTGPWLMGSWSAQGLDGMSGRFHRWTRRHASRSRRPRPVVVNTWEASYFDHDLGRLIALADAAAGVGAERFVLDDGWFAGRRDDRAGLGDWTVDPQVWPVGLHPLVDHVKRVGMDFGLWVEPEMVNVDSDLARSHPDWILRGRAALPDEWRHQQVLDLQVPAAYTYVHDALEALLGTYDIAFLKWDHNRDLVDVAHGGRPAVHGQTLAFYRLLDELRAAHPNLEIESCASGGGRIDLEVLTRTDRIWPSDTLDPLERQRIQRWTSLLVPPEMTGTHLGAPVAHTTGRTHGLHFRAATALIGHFGIEWDLGKLGPDELAAVAEWVSLHQRMRPVIGSGTLVHGDHPDPAILITGVVAADADEAWFVVAAIDSTVTRSPLPVRLPGLESSRSYQVKRVTPCGSPDGTPPTGGAPKGSGLDVGVVVTGGVLASVGLTLPAMLAESAEVLHVRATGGLGA